MEKEEKEVIVCPHCGYENSNDTNFCSKCGYPLTNDVVPTAVVRKQIFEVGKIIDNRYKIIELIGKGGMGMVYLARDNRLKKKVALKTLPSYLLSDKTFKERLVREAVTLGQIEHPNICNVYDIVEKEDYAYIVMQYIEGESLSSLMKENKLDFDSIIDIAIQIAGGLKAAHDKGIIHRDIKPSNILITKDGLVKILDFGLAKSVGKGEIEDIGGNLTQTGMIVGTVSYMSPEQAEGKELDNRSDIFSFGIVLYEMFTGKRPFEGESHLSILANILSKEELLPSKIKKTLPKQLDKIIKKALQKDREKRYQDIEELKKDLLKLKEKKSNFKKRSFISSLSLKIISLLLLLFFIAFFILRPFFKKPLIIILKPETGKNVSKLLGSEIEFLLNKSLSQFSKYEIMNSEGYKDLLKRWRKKAKIIEKEKIKFFLKPKVNKIGKMINIDTELYIPGKTKKTITVNGEGTSSILSYQVDKITERMKDYLNIKKDLRIKRISGLLTSNWDAFINFFHGYKSWKELYISDANKFFKKALKFDPDMALPYYFLAEISIFNGDYKGAKDFIKKAYKKSKNLNSYDKAIIMALYSKLTLKFKKEREYLKEIINLKPRDKMSYYNLGEAYFHLGDVKKALKYYKKALEIDKDFSLALNHAGFCLSYLGEHIKALDFLERYKEINRGANAYDSLGDGFFYMGDYLNARNNKLTAISINPNLNWIYYSLGFIYYIEGDLKNAFFYNKVYTKRSKSKKNIARAAFQRSLFYFFQNNIEKAEREIDFAISTYDVRGIYTIIPELYYLKGRIALTKDDLNTAEKNLSILRNIVKKYTITEKRFFPVLKFYLSLRAFVLNSKGKKREALKIMNKLISMKEKLGYWSTFFNYPYFLYDYIIILKAQNKDYTKILKKLDEYNSFFFRTFVKVDKINKF